MNATTTTTAATTTTASKDNINNNGNNNSNNNSSNNYNSNPSFVPSNFGSERGPEVSNRNDVLREVDRALGRTSPPAVEYLFVRPFSSFRIPFTNIGIGYNFYGHSAVRYRLPNGEEKIMNIVGKDCELGGKIVTFVDPSDYLFSTHFHSKQTSSQMGLYNRSIVSVRVEEAADEDILKMHEYFVGLEKRSEDSDAKFDMVFGPLYNFVRAHTRIPGVVERGNCARYTSKGLHEGGFVQNVSMWPKSIWIHMFENRRHQKLTPVSKCPQTATSTISTSPAHAEECPQPAMKNVNVVSYRRIKHAQLTHGVNAKAIEAVAPLQSLRSFVYWNLEWFADVVVEVPEGTTYATVTRVDDPVPPSSLRNIMNSPYTIGTSVCITGLLLMRNQRMLLARMRRGWK
eukprot:TRINITY_DN3250_c0_g1_i1.p1 TRINITY_DN3250_c0_g1~~TRINITY_DN3250_c0_g1_i1.p1  ORF type:complete len:435 (-),score=87.15 TRINITY_DN3250_c0_g1_i1:96-1295(-)